MEKPFERLRHARNAAGFASASAAARHFGWGEANYRHHENGTRSYGVEQAVRYAEAFSVPATWLLDISSSPADLWRLPIGRVYTEALMPQLSIWPGLEELADQAQEMLGLFHIPELEISINTVDPVRDESDRPVFHFVSPAAVGVDPSKFERGFMFMTRSHDSRPPSLIGKDDLCLVDSEAGEIGSRPDLWLLRHYDNVIVSWAKVQADGQRLLVPDGLGEKSSALDPQANIVGRVVWVSRRIK